MESTCPGAQTPIFGEQGGLEGCPEGSARVGHQLKRGLENCIGAGFPFLFGRCYVPAAAAAVNAAVADLAVAGEAADVRGAGGAICAVVATYAPGGTLRRRRSS